MITKNEIKQQSKGVLLAVGTWMVVVNANELLIKFSPIKNQIGLGIILIMIYLLWD